MAEQASFEREIEHWIVGALSTVDPPMSFDDLVCVLPGVFPVDVLRALERMEARATLDDTVAARLKERAISRPEGCGDSVALPVPHPLDFDWRFSPAAVQRLTHECLAERSAYGPVLVGAPSVWQAIRERGSAGAVLLDANPVMIEALRPYADSRHRALLHDVREDVPQVRASDAVLLDPPWYPEHQRLFLWTASQVCKVGGRVLVSMPAVGTRPGIPRDREDGFGWARRLGFALETQDEGVLPYTSPPFERNALAAAGISGLPPEWRRGDLIVLRKLNDVETSKPVAYYDPPWDEVTIKKVRIRVRFGRSAGGDLAEPTLTTIVAGDVLDSVSRRDPRREHIKVWTSGNRVFGTRSPDVLLEVLRGVAAGEDAVARVVSAADRRLSRRESAAVATAAEQVARLVETERAELAEWGWPA